MNYCFGMIVAILTSIIYLFPLNFKFISSFNK